MREEIKINEVKSFFAMVLELNEALKNNDQVETEHLLDEIYGVYLNTDQGSLRRRASQLLDEHRPARALLA